MSGRQCEHCLSKLTPYTYFFVRQDIPIADQIVQIGHVGTVAGTAYTDLNIGHAHLVLVGVEDGHVLDYVISLLNLNTLDHVTYHENYGLTAIATAPVFGATRKLFKNFPIWQPVYKETKNETQASFLAKPTVPVGTITPNSVGSPGESLA